MHIHLTKEFFLNNPQNYILKIKNHDTDPNDKERTQTIFSKTRRFRGRMRSRRSEGGRSRTEECQTTLLDMQQTIALLLLPSPPPRPMRIRVGVTSSPVARARLGAPPPHPRTPVATSWGSLVAEGLRSPIGRLGVVMPDPGIFGVVLFYFSVS